MAFAFLARRFRVVIAVIAIAPHLPRPALAAPGDAVNACISSYERHDRAVAAGDFIEARRGLAQCASATCPAAMQRECVSALAALEPRIPTVILVARDEQKRDLTNVRVLVDGVVMRTQLDGRELEINPGKHVVRFEAPGTAPVEKTVVIRERDKGRVLEAEFAPRSGEPLAPHPSPSPLAATPSEASSQSRGVPTLSWILGGVGVAALGTSAAFGAAALAARSDANDCKPNCSGRQIDIVNERLFAADIGLGVGVVSLVAAVVVYLVTPPDRPRTPAAHEMVAR